MIDPIGGFEQPASSTIRPPSRARRIEVEGGRSFILESDFAHENIPKLVFVQFGRHASGRPLRWSYAATGGQEGRGS